MTNTIDCPYCNHEHEPVGSHEDDSGKMECESCGKHFSVEIEYIEYYITTPLED